MSADEFVKLLENSGYESRGDVFEKQGPDFVHQFKVGETIATYSALIEPKFTMPFNLDSFHPDELQWIENILTTYLL